MSDLTEAERRRRRGRSQWIALVLAVIGLAIGLTAVMRAEGDRERDRHNQMVDDLTCALGGEADCDD